MDREMQRLRNKIKDLQDQIAKIKEGPEIQTHTGFD
jgi:hypothetical protein